MAIWLEIIELQAGNDTGRKFHHMLEELKMDLTESSDVHNVKFFSNLSVENDFSIHLVHKSSLPETGGSPIGLYITSSLREFGLVNHQIWCEMDRNENSLETQNGKN
jgi:hypothetical protein